MGLNIWMKLVNGKVRRLAAKIGDAAPQTYEKVSIVCRKYEFMISIYGKIKL